MRDDPLIDTQLGAYHIQAKLGEGGMAQVYKAYHARLRREVAIKVILPQIADQSGFRDRFEREAQLIASLEQRNIVAVYDFGEIGNLSYLVMQYVGGGTLRDLLRREGKIEPHRAVQYAIQMARALHHAHQRGIVHRDVKPQNMLVSANNPNEILLSDFGIAKLFDSSSQETLLPSTAGGARNDPALTNVDQMVGTADYMAPEQINRQPVDARTDVYALGIVLFQMLTGQVPFSSTTVQGLLFQQVYTPAKPVREINPSISPLLEQIILQALAKAPEQRYQSAEAMALALEAVLTGPTYPSSTLLTGNYASAYGHPSSDPLTYASQTRLPSSAHSYYGQPSVPATPAIGQPIPPAIQIGNGSAATPTQPRVKRKFRPSYLLYILLIALSIVLISDRVLLPALCTSYNLFCASPSQSTAGTIPPFTTEKFQNNDHNWSGNQGGLTAIVENDKYALSVSDGNTYFPHPAPIGTADGPLLANFTLTVTMEQTQGNTSIPYGIAFRLQGDTSHVNSYAFVIDGKGDYQLLKYKASVESSSLQGQVSFIHGSNQFNVLQVIVHGNNFSFSINNQLVPLAGSTNHSYTDTDQPFTGGQLGLLVAGPNTAITVTSVVLTT